MRIKKLGFYYHIVLTQGKDGLKIPSFLGVFLDSLAKEVDILVIFGHEAKAEEIISCDYILKETNIQWVNLGFKTPFWDRVLFPSKILDKAKPEILTCEATLVRAPSPLAPYFYSKFGKKTKIAFLMVGDYLEGLKAQKESFYRKIPILLLTYFNEMMQNKAIRNSQTFVNSRLLFNKYKSIAKELSEVKTTTLSNSDFFERKDSFSDNSDEINILFTGRISFSKGVLDIITVASRLYKEGKNVKAHFVGWEDNPEKPVEKAIQLLASQYGLLELVFFHGKKSVGPELFSMYRKAQVYILPSQSDFEGFPRTIWEAMANSLPVVATRVGSIPYFVENELHILMVEPKNIEALYTAVKNVVENKRLRESLISNSYNFVKEVTLEKQTKLLIEHLK